MNDNELSILKALSGRKEKSSVQLLADSTGLALAAVMSGVESLSQKGFLSLERNSKTRLTLSAEGRDYASKGLPEERLAKAVKKETELSKAIEQAGLSESEGRIALQWVMRRGWLKAEKRDGKTILVKAKEVGETQEERVLQALVRDKRVGGVADEAVLAQLKQRGLVTESEDKQFFAKANAKGEKAFAVESVKISQLTTQLLKTGEWRGKSFREYDVSTVAAPRAIARKHVYKEFLTRIKSNLVGLGFREVHGPLVELEFWNMDALFMPQDHPAREIHDIFKAKSKHGPAQVAHGQALERVKQAHETGLDGSSGWRYLFNPQVSAQLVLRSQTTAVSARHLAGGLPSPTKLFSIGRVFRPDEIDWKHFIEFNQCEGIVLDEDTNFRELLGYLKAFAQEVFGADKVRFTPMYYPFVEPGVDMSVDIPGRGWTEVGGAGVFRPEMLAALGVQQPVLAWGLGIDRLAMLTLGITDIRELNSHKIDFLRSR